MQCPGCVPRTCHMPRTCHEYDNMLPEDSIQLVSVCPYSQNPVHIPVAQKLGKRGLISPYRHCDCELRAGNSACHRKDQKASYVGSTVAPTSPGSNPVAQYVVCTREHKRITFWEAISQAEPRNSHDNVTPTLPPSMEPAQGPFLAQLLTGAPVEQR